MLQIMLIFERNNFFLPPNYRMTSRIARTCSRYILTVLNSSEGIFPLYSGYVLTVIDRAGGMLRPCSRYVSTVLDRAKGMFRPCSSFVLTKNGRC